MSGRSFETFIAAILLAAGLSTRANPRNKLLVTTPGDDAAQPMVRRSAEILLTSRVRSVIVVTGHEAADVEAALDGLDVTFVHNPDYADGMASSLAARAGAPRPTNLRQWCATLRAYGQHCRRPDGQGDGRQVRKFESTELN